MKNLYRDWTFAKEALQLIVRKWNWDLSPHEFRAVIYIYDRTIGWGKEWEAITLDHAYLGVWNDDQTENWGAPIASNKARASELLKTLADKGYIYKRKRGCLSEYSLNLDTMKVPKRLQICTQERGDTSVVLGVTLLKEKGDTSVTQRVSSIKEEIFDKKKSSHNEVVAGVEKEDPLSEIRYATTKIVDASKVNRDRKKKSKGVFVRRANETGFVPFRGMFPVIWKDMNSSFFPDFEVGPIPHLSLNIIHSYAIAWTNNRKTGEFMEYLNWVFQNWSALGAGVFGWMSEFPLSPSVRIITSKKLRGFIEEAYQKKEMWDAWRKMDEYERKVYHLVNVKGMDSEKAAKVAKKEVGYVEQGKELAKAKKEIQIMSERAEQVMRAEREALAKQKKSLTQRVNHLVEVEGDFGKWEDEE